MFIYEDNKRYWVSSFSEKLPKEFYSYSLMHNSIHDSISYRFIFNNIIPVLDRCLRPYNCNFFTIYILYYIHWVHSRWASKGCIPKPFNINRSVRSIFLSSCNILLLALAIFNYPISRLVLAYRTF